MGKTFDEVASLLGEFGPYQKRVYFLLCLPAITGCFQTLIYVFTMDVPQHRCAVPGLQNDTYVIQSPEHAAIVNASIPDHYSCHVILNVTSAVTSLHDVQDFSHETVTSELRLPLYNKNVSSPQSSPAFESPGSLRGNHSSSQSSRCFRYVYDRSVYEETIATQMGLVCDKQSLLAHAKMFFMLGSLFGALVCQPLSDVFGRKTILMASLALHAVVSLAITWATYFAVLCALMLLSNMAITSMFANAFVIGIELVGPSKRVYAGYVVEIFWSLGMIILAPVAYVLRHWQRLQLATSLVPIVFLSYYWLIPESPRWLLSKGRIQEAEAILRRAARVNKVRLPAGLLNFQRLAEERKVSVWSVFRHPVLLARCVVIFYNWFVSSLAFYGLALNIGNLSGSIYLNFFLTGVTELVTYVVCICLLDRLGRRLLNSGLMLLAGISCTLTLFPVLYAPPSLQWLTTVLAIAGRMGIAGGFATIYIYSSELFPTVVRNSAMGASSSFARIGSVISPYIASLATVVGGDAGIAVPLVVFGLSSILAGCLLLTLPETLKRQLPETVEDAINYTRYSAEETKTQDSSTGNGTKDEQEMDTLADDSHTINI